MKTIYFGISFFTCLLLGCTHSEKQPSDPNIILIYADDLGYGDVETLNQASKIPTPHINKLADEGISFTNAHAPASVCTPSRYSLLTGQYSWRSTMKKGVKWVWERPLIKENDFTVAHMLQQQGYTTALIGKWHLGWNWPTIDGKPATLQNEGRNVDYSQPIKGGPVSCGFDYYFGDDTPSFPPHAFIENDRVVVKPTEWLEPGQAGIAGAMAPGWRYEDLQTKITDKALEFISRQVSENPEKPFFLFYSSSAPHTPIAPREDFAGKTNAGKYGDFVYEMDYHIGRIISTLDSLNISENTMVIFTSDNGPTNQDGTNYTGEIGSLLKYDHNSSGTYRGIKSDAWEGGHRVPFIVKWPGEIKPGSTSDALACQVDLMATFAAMLKAELPKEKAVDSYNMLPALTKGNSYRNALVTQSGEGILSIQKDNWKLIASSGSGGKWSLPAGNLPELINEDGRLSWKNVQLYNIEKDPDEKENLARQNSEKTHELLILLKEYIINGRSTPGENIPLDAEELWNEVAWIKELK